PRLVPAGPPSHSGSWSGAKLDFLAVHLRGDLADARRGAERRPVDFVDAQVAKVERKQNVLEVRGQAMERAAFLLALAVVAVDDEFLVPVVELVGMGLRESDDEISRSALRVDGDRCDLGNPLAGVLQAVDGEAE